MNGSAENRASGASEREGGEAVVFTWSDAQRMLPLVRGVVGDFLEAQTRLERLAPEKARLDRHRRDLSWPERARRYQLQEESAALEQQLHELLGELSALGLVMLEPAEGRVGFATVVNDRPAFFAWQPGDDGLRYWQFGGEKVRRNVPPSWAKPEGRASGRTK